MPCVAIISTPAPSPPAPSHPHIRTPSKVSAVNSPSPPSSPTCAAQRRPPWLSTAFTFVSHVRLSVCLSACPCLDLCTIRDTPNKLVFSNHYCYCVASHLISVRRVQRRPSRAPSAYNPATPTRRYPCPVTPARFSAVVLPHKYRPTASSFSFFHHFFRCTPGGSANDSTSAPASRPRLRENENTHKKKARRTRAVHANANVASSLLKLR